MTMLFVGCCAQKWPFVMPSHFKLLPEVNARSRRSIFLLLVFTMTVLLEQYALLYKTNELDQASGSDESSPSSPGKPEQKRLLPTPILVVGLPKTGTSTVHNFFKKSGYSSSHYKCNESYFCGMCFKSAIKSGKPPLASCGGYEVYAQMDVENTGQCHFPQITDLEILHEEAPNATFILSTRNMTHWATSVRNWVGGVRSMAGRLAKCEEGPKTRFPDDLIVWHHAHLERIREFVRTHPSHTLVEIDIEDPRTGEIMAQRFGSDARFWGHVNDGTKTNASLTKSRERG
jgi:hypothetical protein